MDSEGIRMGFRRGPKGFLRDSSGIPDGFLRDSSGIPMGFLRGSFRNALQNGNSLW